MKVATLFIGLLALLALLLAAGVLGGVGSVEIAVWSGLVAAWIFWWLMSRRARRTSP